MHTIQCVLDLGCGNFEVGKCIAPECTRYVGIDVVLGLIERNRIMFSAASNIEFICLDITTDALPKADANVDIENGCSTRIDKRGSAVYFDKPRFESPFCPRLPSASAIELGKRGALAYRKDRAHFACCNGLLIFMYLAGFAVQPSGWCRA